MMKRLAIAAPVLLLSGSALAQERVPRAWKIVRDTDAVTDVRSVTALYPAESGSAALAIRCEIDKHPRLSVQLLPISVEAAARDGRTKVFVRFDKAAAFEQVWQVAAAGALYPPDRSQVHAMFHPLYRAEHLLLRLQPISGQPDDVEFKLSGTAAAIDEIGKDCPIAIEFTR